MTYVYLDTSVAVHALRGTPAAEAWFDTAAGQRGPMSQSGSGQGLVSSRVLQTELTRVLRRDGVAVQARDEILRQVDLAPVTESILTAAEAIQEHVKTLDSIHLATALALGSSTVLVTHDANQKRVASVLGLRFFDPIDR